MGDVPAAIAGSPHWRDWFVSQLATKEASALYPDAAPRPSSRPPAVAGGTPDSGDPDQAFDAALRPRTTGDFVVRSSSSDSGCFVLVVRLAERVAQRKFRVEPGALALRRAASCLLPADAVRPSDPASPAQLRYVINKSCPVVFGTIDALLDADPDTAYPVAPEVNAKLQRSAEAFVAPPTGPLPALQPSGIGGLPGFDLDEPPAYLPQAPAPAAPLGQD